MAAYTSIDDPSAYFKVQLYTGDGNSSNAITFNDTDTDMQPDLVWIKNRTATSSGSHILNDAVRGTQKALYPNGTDAEASTSDGLSAFGSDGFTVGDGAIINYNNDNYVAWCWKAGTSFSNDASATSVGSIDSAGSINTTSGFAIIRWSGTAANATIAHGIAAPKMMIIKRISGGTESWVVYHQAISPAKHLFLNGTDAENADTNNFQNTATTSSVFSVGTYNQMNASGTNNMIAYCFAEKQGFSKFGSYTGNGNADGTFVYTGFRPAWFLTKKSSASGNNWTLWDNKRDTKNPMDLLLHPNSSNAENDSGDNIDFCSNGVKLRNTAGGNNASGATYIFMAFAEAPFVNSNGVPCNAR